MTDVFVRGSDGALYSKQFSGGSWGSWKKIGGQVACGSGHPMCAQNASSLDVFGQGMDGAMYHKSYTGGSWSKNWESLGRTLTSSPATTSPGNGTTNVFARGTSGALYEKTYNNGWYAWTSIGSTWS